MFSIASEPILAARPAATRQRVVRVSVWQAAEGVTAFLVRNEHGGERNFHADIHHHYDPTPASLRRLALAVFHTHPVRSCSPHLDGGLGWEWDA